MKLKRKPIAEKYAAAIDAMYAAAAPKPGSQPVQASEPAAASAVDAAR